MRFILLGLCLIEAIMAGYPIFPTSTYPLVICAGLNADYVGLGTTTFPDALMESNCVAIDVCSEVNNRGESVPRDTWLHRSLDSLVYDGEHDLAATGVYNYFNIEYARIPSGVEVQFCAPDFAHHRTTGEYACDNMTLTSVSSDCPPISYAGSTFDMTACLTAAQYDAESEFTAALYGTTQMLRYSFVEDWGCLTNQQVSAGIQLSSAAKPNTLIPCQEIPHAIYNIEHGCEFTCEYGYTKGVNVCSPNCIAETETACAVDHRVVSECNLMTPSRYQCQQCPVEAGQRTLPWDPATSRKTQCQYEPCPAGTYGVNGGCQDCPINYKSSEGASECQLCEHGFHQPETGKTSCVACFSETVEVTTGGPGNGDLRLVGCYPSTANVGKTSCYVEIYFNGQWGNIAQTWWSSPGFENNAIIACQQLGCSGGVYIAADSESSDFKPVDVTGNSLFWLQKVYCSPDSLRIDNCTCNAVDWDQCSEAYGLEITSVNGVILDCDGAVHDEVTGVGTCPNQPASSGEAIHVCEDGEMLVRNVSELDAYFASEALSSAQKSTYDLLAFCADSYACVPCRPGFYEDGHTCQPCETGKYQPNFKMTECFSCSTGQTTTATASDQASDCVCMPGFE